ncbi:hypothetical protein N7468_000213 [Penicillium chermesinum]|uniref:Uncharacterized protein n=1 Tax=Penicillium chermesinum TaxID=63820 RepID=A0A9W9PJU4_9EURO|nr:uncharacterized protein N7468_000213 [Penicillium chermesinum]KAJ5248762.1 hypothetical protein N7468_000213 [Penicillium chermesinum]
MSQKDHPQPTTRLHASRNLVRRARKLRKLGVGLARCLHLRNDTRDFLWVDSQSEASRGSAGAKLKQFFIKKRLVESWKAQPKYTP